MGADHAAVDRRNAVLEHLVGLAGRPGVQSVTAGAMHEVDPSVPVGVWARTLDAMAQVAGARRLLYRVTDARGESFALAPDGWRAARRQFAGVES